MIDVKDLKPAVAERLLELEEEAWGDMYLQLLDYAGHKTRRLSDIKGGGDLPLGRTPKDLVHDAMERVFDGRRQWNPEKDPDLCQYLKSVIKSLFSALLEKADHDYRDNAPLENHHDLESGEDANYNDCLEALENILRNASSTDQNLDNVRVGIEDGMKASEISDFFSIDVKRVYTLSRKLRRRVRKRMQQHPCNDQWTQIGF